MTEARTDYPPPQPPQGRASARQRRTSAQRPLTTPSQTRSLRCPTAKLQLWMCCSAQHLRHLPGLQTRRRATTVDAMFTAVCGGTRRIGLRRVWPFVWALACLGACGDDGANAVGGVDRDRALSDISKQEFQDVCAELGRRLVKADGALSGFCRLRQVLSAELLASEGRGEELCGGSTDACVAKYAGFHCQNLERLGCAVTVGELTDCSTMSDARWQEFGAASCDDLVMYAQSQFSEAVSPVSPMPPALTKCSMRIDRCWALGRGTTTPVMSEGSCADDADCDGGACADGPLGMTCTDGELDQPCNENAQCDLGHCVDTHTFELAACSAGDVGMSCDAEDDGDCADHRCAWDPSGDIWSCRAGNLGDFCNKPSHCVDGACALSRYGYGSCTDAATGSACASDADCESGGCLMRESSPLGECVDGMDGSPCMNDAQCVSNRCATSISGSSMCTDGALSSPCTEDADCESMLCSFDSGLGFGECVDGMSGSSCFVHEDCVDGLCAYRTGGGECTDGQLGSVCTSGGECDSTYCYRKDEKDEVGVCTSGATGARCVDRTDCESGSCAQGVCD